MCFDILVYTFWNFDTPLIGVMCQITVVSVKYSLHFYAFLLRMFF